MIDGHTKIFGILGYPVGHSLSPRIHNAAFAARKINAIYVPFPIEKADQSLKKAILRLPLQGLSVTIPHKGWAARAADECDDLSRACGAANTLYKNKAGQLLASNTDGAGALKALKQGVPNLRGRRVLLIGYGGSAAAIAHSLLLDAKLSMLLVYGRNQSKARNFCQKLRDQHSHSACQIGYGSLGDTQPADIDIIIHTTPLGMQGQEQQLPLPADFIQNYHTVFDIVYNPARTPLLVHAAQKKARTIPGYMMLLYQAILQFEIFSGQSAPVNLMEKELLSALRQAGIQGHIPHND